MNTKSLFFKSTRTVVEFILAIELTKFKDGHSLIDRWTLVNFLNCIASVGFHKSNGLQLS